MRTTVQHSSLGFLLAAALLLPVASALGAQAPTNDSRDAARALSALPVSVDGTTTGSTLERNEEPTCQGVAAGSVWYEITAPDKGRIVVRLAAKGKLDAVLDVFQRTRSQVTQLGSACDPTDRNGEAAVRFNADAKGSTYLVRVSQRANSQPGTSDSTCSCRRRSRACPAPSCPRTGWAGRSTGSRTPRTRGRRCSKRASPTA